MGIRRTFKPGVIQSVVFLCVFGLLIWLGWWQLDRAEEKSFLQQQHKARAALPTLNLNTDVLDAEEMDLRLAVVSGVYRSRYQIFLDNKVHRGQAGYHVITPLQIDGRDSILMVNQGWIAGTGDRQQLPSINNPEAQITLQGRLKLPATDYFTLADESSAEFEALWQNVDLVRFQKLTGLLVYPVILELSPENTTGNELVRDWPVFHDNWIQRHRGYAIQWFGLATVLVIVFVVLNLKPYVKPNDELTQK